MPKSLHQFTTPACVLLCMQRGGVGVAHANQAVCVSAVCPPVQLQKQLTDYQGTSYELACCLIQYISNDK
jgi:hypothetical protein